LQSIAWQIELSEPIDMMNSQTPDLRDRGNDHSPTADLMQGAEYDESWLSPLLMQYWQAVLRWRWIIAGIIAAALVAGLVITLMMPAQYTAKTQIEISREQKKITNVRGIESDTEARDIEFYATQYALLKAESLAERVVRKLRLAGDPVFLAAHGLEPLQVSEPNSARQRSDAEQRRAISILLSNVDVSPIRASRLVDISYTSRSPQLSAKIANAWAQEFV
jgi:uncharacterized protein involved in exopolysaccharide biosynthesis